MSIIENLNSELTDIFYSSKFFKADGWDTLISLLEDAKKDCYQIQVAPGVSKRDFTKREKYFLFKAISSLSVIIIYKAELVISKTTYDENDVESLLELIEENIDYLDDQEDKPTVPINFFKLTGNRIEFKNLPHFHIHDTVERLIRAAVINDI